jgi:O-antigen/teichoic acid export membrane protein
MALHRFAQNTFFATLAGLSSALAGLAASIIVARMMGPDGAGAVALAVWIAGTAVTLGDLGLPLTISRFLPGLDARGARADAAALPGLLIPALLATTAVGVGVSGAAFLAVPAIERLQPGLLGGAGLPPSAWLAIAALFAAQALGNYGLARLRGEQRFGLAARVSIAAALMQVAGVGVGCAWFGVDGALLGYALGSVAPAFFLPRPRRAAGGVDPALRRRAWRFALDSWGAGLISVIVWTRSELAFLNYWRGPHETGLYAVAITLCLIAAQGPLLMTGGLLALLSERHARGDQEGLARGYAGALRFVGALLFPACFGMAAIAPVLLPTFFGPAFAPAAPVATFLVAAQAFGSITTVASTLLFATEKNRFLVHTGLLGALALLVAGVTIIPAFGLMGTAAARVTIQCVLAGAAFLYVDRLLGCRAPYGALARIVAAAALCGLAARWIVVLLPTQAGLALAIGAGVCVYAGALGLLRPFTREDLAQLATLADRFPRFAGATAPLLARLGAQPAAPKRGA